MDFVCACMRVPVDHTILIMLENDLGYLEEQVYRSLDNQEFRVHLVVLYIFP